MKNNDCRSKTRAKTTGTHGDRTGPSLDTLDSVVGNHHRQAALLYLCQHARAMSSDLRLGDGFRRACAELLDELTDRANSISNIPAETRASRSLQPIVRKGES